MIEKLKLPISPTEPLLIGVSGGPDSVALLHALVKLGCRPHVCHLNHQWRGAESDADAKFVRQYAAELGLSLSVESRTVDRNENAARQARLQFFESIAARTGIHTLALAHTADDQVETFLLRLLRGAAAPGLSGMRAEQQIGSLRIVRPMLKVRRHEVLEYIRAHGLKYREDASNLDPRFLRNRIRHELLPLFEREYNPAIRDVLLRTAEVLRDEDELLTQLATAGIASLHHQPIALQRRMLRAWLGDVGFEHIEAIRQLAPGAAVTLPGGTIVRRQGDGLEIVEQTQPVGGRWPLNLQVETRIPELGIFLDCHSERSEERHNVYKSTSTNSQGDRSVEGFDADTLGDAPCIRTWQPGDRFQPLGMTGEKKLQDFFVDEKIPQWQRHRIPVLCATDGRIAWLVGHRIAEPFKITEHTKRVLTVRVVPI
jgi:tRNA(Ile)-lysidine synthase